MTKINWPNLNEVENNRWYNFGVYDSCLVSKALLNDAARRYVEHKKEQDPISAAYWAGILHGKEINENG